MYRKFLLIVFMSTAVVSTSCGMFKGRGHVAHPDPNGSVAEKIAYHESEIRKYQNAIDQEKQTSVRSLQRRNMSEVRRSNNKQAIYERKIKENQQAIRELESQQRGHQ